MRLETVGIAADGVTLAALRYLPDRSPRPTALLFSHGFTAGKYSLDGLAGYLAGRGYEGLTFDFVGHKLGATGGEMWRAEQAVDNLSAALGWLRRHSAARNVVLIGHSMGAVATLGLAAREAMAHKEPEGSALAGLACLCTGLEPTRGFEGAIGQAQRLCGGGACPAVAYRVEHPGAHRARGGRRAHALYRGAAGCADLNRAGRGAGCAGGSDR